MARYVIISREIFNPNYALFKSSPGDRVNQRRHDLLFTFCILFLQVTYTINDSEFRSFYKHILAKVVKHQDMEYDA